MNEDEIWREVLAAERKRRGCIPSATGIPLAVLQFAVRLLARWKWR